MVKRFRGGLISANPYYTSVNNITYGSNTLFIGQQLTPTQSSYNVNRQITYGNVSNYSFLVNRYDRFPSAIVEGETRTFTVKADNVTNNTTAYWNIKHITTNDADFTANSGSFVTSSGIATFSITASSNDDTENNELFQLEIRTGTSITGVLESTSPSITITNRESIIIDFLAIGGGGGAGGNDGPGAAGQGAGGASGGIVSGSAAIIFGQQLTVSVGGAGGGGTGATTGTGGGTAGSNGGGRGGNAGTSPNSGAGGGGGGWSGILSGPTYYMVAGGGAGGGGSNEGTANDVNASGGGIQPGGANGVSLTGTQGVDYPGDGGGGGGGGGGYYGGLGYTGTGSPAPAQGGGGNYTNPTYISSAALVNGNPGQTGPSGGAGGASTVYSWVGYSNDAGAGGTRGSGPTASGAAGASGKIIIRYLGSQLCQGGTYSSASGYSYHTFTSATPSIFYANL